MKISEEPPFYTPRTDFTLTESNPPCTFLLMYKAITLTNQFIFKKKPLSYSMFLLLFLGSYHIAIGYPSDVIYKKYDGYLTSNGQEIPFTFHVPVSNDRDATLQVISQISDERTRLELYKEILIEICFNDYSYSAENRLINYLRTGLGLQLPTEIAFITKAIQLAKDVEGVARPELVGQMAELAKISAESNGIWTVVGPDWANKWANFVPAIENAGIAASLVGSLLTMVEEGRQLTNFVFTNTILMTLKADHASTQLELIKSQGYFPEDWEIWHRALEEIETIINRYQNQEYFKQFILTAINEWERFTRGLVSFTTAATQFSVAVARLSYAAAGTQAPATLQLMGAKILPIIGAAVYSMNAIRLYNENNKTMRIASLYGNMMSHLENLEGEIPFLHQTLDNFRTYILLYALAANRLASWFDNHFVRFLEWVSDSYWRKDFEELSQDLTTPFSDTIPPNLEIIKLGTGYYYEIRATDDFCIGVIEYEVTNRSTGQVIETYSSLAGFPFFSLAGFPLSRKIGPVDFPAFESIFEARVTDFAGNAFSISRLLGTPWGPLSEPFETWHHSTEFGMVHQSHDPYWLHQEHGWVVPEPDNSEGLFIYDSSLSSWWWTRQDLYPFMQKYGDNEGWYWYQRGGSPGERWFRRLVDGQMLHEAQLMGPSERSADMVLAPGGTLSMSMGTRTVNTFYIGRYEVTLGEWQEVRRWGEANGYEWRIWTGAGCAVDHPVHSVSWYDVLKWCNAKSEKEGLTPVYTIEGEVYRMGSFGQDGAHVIEQNLTANGYRLPLETEWEFAARGGNRTNGYTYAGSNDLNTVGWYRDNSGGAACNLSEGRGTWPVGQKAPNELGLYDMSGNVYEWCWDQSGSARRIRGGSWGDSAGNCAVYSRRLNARPNVYGQYLGFRLARTPEPLLDGILLVEGGTLSTGNQLNGTRVDTFYIGRYEVTWGEWKAVRAEAAARGYDIGNVGAGCADDHPVHSVSWFDVLKWCNLNGS